jgi:hypothetical protein
MALHLLYRPEAASEGVNALAQEDSKITSTQNAKIRLIIGVRFNVKLVWILFISK